MSSILKQRLITPAAGKRLIARAVVESPRVAEVLKSGTKRDSTRQKVTNLAGSNKLYDLYQGDVLGEMSLIDVEPASATVNAISEVGVWSLDRLELNATLSENMEAWNTILANIARILSRRLRDTTAKLA